MQDTYDQFVGQTLRDRDGEKLGTVDDIYADEATGKPEWALVRTGLFGSASTIVPITEATVAGEDVTVPYTKAQVKDAPRVEATEELSMESEATLAQHYGLGYSTDKSPTGVLESPSGVRPATNGVDADATTMTRSEERMHAGVVRRPSELVRLRKSVESEQVSQTVPVRREELHVDRQPITGEIAGQIGSPTISEDSHEVTLHREEPIVSKEVVPVEQVTVGKDVVVEEREITGEVRKERIEVERTNADRR